MATRGLGMSASAQSRSIMSWSSGASWGATSRARIALRARVSELYHWNHTMPSATSPMIIARPGLFTATISPTTTATNRPPSRNIVSVIRAVSPASPTKRVLAIVLGRPRGTRDHPDSVGDESLVAEERPHLLQGRVGRGQHEVGLLQ